MGECDSRGNAARRTKVAGNKFVKVSVAFTTAFEGAWTFRTETHAFKVSRCRLTSG